MEIIDARGKSINQGAYVIYGGTGTIGKVSDIKTIDEDTWAKIDTTDLWYKGSTLQLVDKTDKVITESKEDIKEKIKKRQKLVGEDIDMSNELCDGGG